MRLYSVIMNAITHHAVEAPRSQGNNRSDSAVPVPNKNGARFIGPPYSSSSPTSSISLVISAMKSSFLRANTIPQ